MNKEEKIIVNGRNPFQHYIRMWKLAQSVLLTNLLIYLQKVVSASPWIYILYIFSLFLLLRYIYTKHKGPRIIDPKVSKPNRQGTQIGFFKWLISPKIVYCWWFGFYSIVWGLLYYSNLLENENICQLVLLFKVGIVLIIPFNHKRRPLAREVYVPYIISQLGMCYFMGFSNSKSDIGLCGSFIFSTISSAFLSLTQRTLLLTRNAYLRDTEKMERKLWKSLSQLVEGPIFWLNRDLSVRRYNSQGKKILKSKKCSTFRELCGKLTINEGTLPLTQVIWEQLQELNFEEMEYEVSYWEKSPRPKIEGSTGGGEETFSFFVQNFTEKYNIRINKLKDFGVMISIALIDDDEDFISQTSNLSPIKSNSPVKRSRTRSCITEEVKTILTTTFSHEIKTLLNGILGNLELVLPSLQGDEFTFNTSAHCNTLLLANKFNDLVDYSNIENLQFKSHIIEFTLNGLLNEIIYVSKFKSNQKGLEFLVVMDPKLPKTMLADQQRIQQILLNLTDHAIENADHGKVIISIKTGVSKKIWFKVISKNKDYHTKVVNMMRECTSPIPNNILRKSGAELTSPSVTENFDGINLRISELICKAIGSHIIIKFTPNEGATFKFGIQDGFILEVPKAASKSEYIPIKRPKAVTQYKKRLNLNSIEEIKNNVPHPKSSSTYLKSNPGEDQYKSPNYISPSRISNFTDLDFKKKGDHQKIIERNPVQQMSKLLPFMKNSEKNQRHYSLQIPQIANTHKSTANIFPIHDGLEKYMNKINIVDEDEPQIAKTTTNRRPRIQEEDLWGIKKEGIIEDGEDEEYDEMVIPDERVCGTDRPNSIHSFKHIQPPRRHATMEHNIHIPNIVTNSSLRPRHNSLEEINKSQILIVDDNFTNRFVLKSLLNREGYNSQEAKDGKEGLEIIRKYIQKNSLFEFKMVFMDLQMPLMNGLEATKLITQLLLQNNQNKSLLPIVGISSDSSEADRKNFIRAGAVEFVPKPITTSKLRTLIQKYIRPKPYIQYI